jgi:hypothetical protein
VQREDFTIPGIPNGYRVGDVDLLPSGETVCVLSSSAKHLENPLLMVGGQVFPVPEELISGFLICRAAGDDRLVLVKRRSEADGIGGGVLGRRGEVLSLFAVGDGIREVVVIEDSLVVSKFDEGILGREALSYAIAAFDLEGNLRHSIRDFGVEVAIYATFAMCASGRSDVIFNSYSWSEPQDHVIELHLAKMTSETWVTPQELRWSRAIASAADSLLFYSPFKRHGKLLRWQVGQSKFAFVGSIPFTHYLRGLPNGRFILPQPDGYSIFSFD